MFGSHDVFILLTYHSAQKSTRTYVFADRSCSSCSGLSIVVYLDMVAWRVGRVLESFMALLA